MGPARGDSRSTTDYILPATEVPILGDELSIKRKRLLFRAIRRGTRESDKVIGGFAVQYLDGLDDQQLDRFEALLERNDPEVLRWVIGLEPVPPEFDHDVMQLLKSFKSTLSVH